ncbi:MAG: tol-pal system protein YbgF [Desulfovibrionaceae bacterium CG1_02_65_16]|nr:MAG: tol-pal system protein YbgF [Desulfovibrionaceae bacterium CG1_02_65_16]
MRKPCLIIALCALTLAGCAGKMDAQRGLSEEWRLRSLEENFLNFKETQREQEERVRDQQRKLMDRLRVLEENMAQLQQQLGQAPLKPAAPLASAPTTASSHAALSPAAQALAEVAAENGAPAPAAAAFVAPVKQPSLYDKGMNLVRSEKDPVEGRKTLQQFLDEDPQSGLVPNAIYWIGESYYQEKNYAQAILTFKNVTRRFPKHHKAAASLLKIGMSYVMLGEKDNATLYLRALLKEFPKSEPAPAARKKLAELGG